MRFNHRDSFFCEGRKERKSYDVPMVAFVEERHLHFLKMYFHDSKQFGEKQIYEITIFVDFSREILIITEFVNSNQFHEDF